MLRDAINSVLPSATTTNNDPPAPDGGKVVRKDADHQPTKGALQVPFISFIPDAGGGLCEHVCALDIASCVPMLSESVTGLIFCIIDMSDDAS